MKTFRQGDVILIETTKQPSKKAKTVTDQGRVVLAYGEVTGHSHDVVEDVPMVGDPDRIPASQLFEEPDGTRLLVIKRPVALKHQEHDPIALDAGVTFEVRRQSEWSLDDVRQVAD